MYCLVMGQSNSYLRHQKLYTNDNEGKEVFPKNCVPEDRPKSSWTKGVKAYTKGVAGANDSWVGWFAPPRFKKGKSMDRGTFNFTNVGEQE
jgi:hypothetical protein|tara:strand:- start:204 stop:476 length:273 start_codon:yes stop_codon:yes gene_type:complete